MQKNLYEKLSELSFKGFEYYADVYQEIVITRLLSNLHGTVVDYRGHEFCTHSYPRVFCAKIVHGEVPNYLFIRRYPEDGTRAKAIERFDDYSGVPKEQLVLAMKYCGESLWSLMQTPFRVRSTGETEGISAEQLLSVAYQVTLALAVAQACYQFEHRDLHICNVLVKTTKKSYVDFTMNSNVYRVKSVGIKAIIIDATFSRICLGKSRVCAQST